MVRRLLPLVLEAQASISRLVTDIEVRILLTELVRAVYPTRIRGGTLLMMWESFFWMCLESHTAPLEPVGRQGCRILLCWESLLLAGFADCHLEYVGDET